MNYTALVERARSGDNEAIADLYNDTYKDAYFFALSESKNEHDALDILQNCYIEAFSKLDKLQEPEKFLVWFKSIIANRTVDFFRKKKPMFFADMSAGDTNEDIDFVDDSASARMYSPEGSVDYTETQRLVQEILDELSDEQRIVALMYYFQEFSVKQIAEILECNENTVKSRLNYARKKIKEEVLALEKKGTKLYGLTPIPFFIWLLLQLSQEPQLSTSTAAQVLQNVQQGTAAAKGTAAASANAKAAGAVQQGTKAAGVAAKAGLSGKAIAGIVAGVLVVVAGVGVVVGNIVARNVDTQTDSETTVISDAADFGSTSEMIASSEKSDVDLSGYSLAELIGPVSAASNPDVKYMGFLIDTPSTREINSTLEAKAEEYYELASKKGHPSTELLELGDASWQQVTVMGEAGPSMGGPNCRQTFIIGEYGRFTVLRHGNIISIDSDLTDGYSYDGSSYVTERLITSVDLTTSKQLTLKNFAEIYGVSVDYMVKKSQSFDEYNGASWTDPNYVFTGDEMCGFTMADTNGTPYELTISAPFEKVKLQTNAGSNLESVVLTYTISSSEDVTSPLLGAWYYEEPKGDGQLVFIGDTAYYDFGYYYSEFFSYAGKFTVDSNTITFDLTSSRNGQTVNIHSVLDYSIDDDQLLLTLVSGDEIFTMRQPGDTITYSKGDNTTFADSQVQSDLTLRGSPAWAKGETGLRLRAGAGTDYDVLESIGEFNNLVVLGNSTSNPEWLYVAYHGILGFVHSDYVTLS